MSKAFHFQIEEKPSSCVATNDERVYGDLNKLYNFEKVAPKPQNWAKIASTSAYGDETLYAGLSSEFAYQDNDKPLCFGFTAPKMTIGNSAGEGGWVPINTQVVIKRFIRRIVRQDYSEPVNWRN
jgi:hypothetical protein